MIFVPHFQIHLRGYDHQTKTGLPVEGTAPKSWEMKQVYLESVIETVREWLMPLVSPVMTDVAI